MLSRRHGRRTTRPPGRSPQGVVARRPWLRLYRHRLGTHGASPRRGGCERRAPRRRRVRAHTGSAHARNRISRRRSDQLPAASMSPHTPTMCGALDAPCVHRLRVDRRRLTSFEEGGRENEKPSASESGATVRAASDSRRRRAASRASRSRERLRQDVGEPAPYLYNWTYCKAVSLRNFNGISFAGPRVVTADALHPEPPDPVIVCVVHFVCVVP